MDVFCAELSKSYGCKRERIFHSPTSKNPTQSLTPALIPKIHLACPALAPFVPLLVFREQPAQGDPTERGVREAAGFSQPPAQQHTRFPHVTMLSLLLLFHSPAFPLLCSHFHLQVQGGKKQQKVNNSKQLETRKWGDKLPLFLLPHLLLDPSQVWLGPAYLLPQHSAVTQEQNKDEHFTNSQTFCTKLSINISTCKRKVPFGMQKDWPIHCKNNMKIKALHLVQGLVSCLGNNFPLSSSAQIAPVCFADSNREVESSCSFWGLWCVPWSLLYFACNIPPLYNLPLLFP